MKIDIEPSVGDHFFYLKDGKIYPAIIIKIEIMDQVTNFNKYVEGDDFKLTRTASFFIQYMQIVSDVPYWQGDNMRTTDAFYKTKTEAARALLKEAGFEPGLEELS